MAARSFARLDEEIKANKEKKKDKKRQKEGQQTHGTTGTHETEGTDGTKGTKGNEGTHDIQKTNGRPETNGPERSKRAKQEEGTEAACAGSRLPSPEKSAEDFLASPEAWYAEYRRSKDAPLRSWTHDLPKALAGEPYSLDTEPAQETENLLPRRLVAEPLRESALQLQKRSGAEETAHVAGLLLVHNLPKKLAAHETEALSASSFQKDIAEDETEPTMQQKTQQMPKQVPANFVPMSPAEEPVDLEDLLKDFEEALLKDVKEAPPAEPHEPAGPPEPAEHMEPAEPPPDWRRSPKRRRSPPSSPESAPETLLDEDEEPDEQLQKKLFHIADQTAEGAERMATVVLRACAMADRHWDRATDAWQERLRRAHELWKQHEESVARAAHSWAQEEQGRALSLETEERRWEARVLERKQALEREQATWRSKKAGRDADAEALRLEGQRLAEKLQEAVSWRAERSPLNIQAELLSAWGVESPEQLLGLLAQQRQNLESFA